MRGRVIEDQKTGYESSICIKTSRLSYMIAKEAAVAASGAAGRGVPAAHSHVHCCGDISG